MGWQERDYAREPAGVYRGAFGRRSGGPWGSIVTKLLVANIVVYVLCYVIVTPLSPLIRGGPQRSNGFVWTPAGPRPAYEYQPGYGEMITSKVLHGQVWRLFTSQYLHSPRMEHILFNMFGLYFLGQALERVWSRRKFFAIYTIAGVCGNLLLMVAGLVGWISPNVPAVGASGCILGLLGAAAVLFPSAEVYIYFLIPIKIRTAALLFAGMYAFNIYRQGENYGGDLCHMAGLVFGAWWAWRGERWWATRTWVGTSRRAFPPHERVWPGVGDGPWARKVERHVVDEGEVDRILAKVREGGIVTLTEQEKRTLLDATERLRQAEARAGRVDRL
jgi:membrane associated rhomboid family serine protease